VYYSSNIFRNNTRSFENSEKITPIFLGFNWRIFGHVMRNLGQSRASENIWWIISYDNRQKLLKSTPKKSKNLF